MKQSDFEQQVVLVFAWRGSGRDRSEYAVLESFPEPISGTVPSQEIGEYIKVEVKSQLNIRSFAIGGETTGVVISARGISWKLDFGRNVQAQKGATRGAEKRTARLRI